MLSTVKISQVQMGKNAKTDIKKRRKRVITGIKRLRANERERARVQKMNAAFLELKRCLPPNDQKRVQTKIDIICYASSLIKSLKASTRNSGEGRSRAPAGWRIKSSVRSVCEQHCCQPDNAPTIVSSRYSAFIPTDIFPAALPSRNNPWPTLPNSSISSDIESLHNVKAAAFSANGDYFDSAPSDPGESQKHRDMPFAEAGCFFSDSALRTVAPVSIITITFCSEIVFL